jgi:hypothetical protein
MYERSTLLLAMVLEPYTKEETRIEKTKMKIQKNMYLSSQGCMNVTRDQPRSAKR